MKDWSKDKGSHLKNTLKNHPNRITFMCIQPHQTLGTKKNIFYKSFSSVFAFVLSQEYEIRFVSKGSKGQKSNQITIRLPQSASAWSPKFKLLLLFVLLFYCIISAK